MISLLRKSMVPLKKFVRYSGCSGCCKCPEDTNLFTTTFKVNLFTFMIVGSIGGTITRSHMILKNDLEELKLLLANKSDKSDK
jgi:hypothetical protein